jgi:Secretion system C-terminal sorting domain
MEVLVKTFFAKNISRMLGQWAFVLSMLLGVTLLIPFIAISQWSVDPKVNNLISSAVNDQVNPVGVSDGAGGVIVAWQDNRSGTNYDIFAQHVSASGEMEWAANGVAICTVDSDQVSPAIISDGSGGAIIAWQDKRSGSFDIYAQHVNESGVLQWSPSTGDSVCTAAFDQVNIVMVSDGSGGALLTWQDSRSTTDIDIWVQRMSSAVAIRWPVNGVVMNNNVAYDQVNPKIVSDGMGGAMMTWEDFRTGLTSDIYAQRVDSTGVVATGWNVNGVAVCTSINSQSNPNIISDDDHGAIITWIDKRDSSTNVNTYDVYASRITGSFALPWTANGVPICTADSTQTNPTTVSDGSGGAIVAWQDKRSGIYEIYASRVFASGTTPVKVADPTPSGFALLQNYPNPFNPSTIISYQLAVNSRVTLKVYDILGKEVATLVNSRQNAGNYNVPFTAGNATLNLSSGVYFYRLQAGSFVTTKKLILMK